MIMKTRRDSISIKKNLVFILNKSKNNKFFLFLILICNLIKFIIKL